MISQRHPTFFILKILLKIYEPIFEATEKKIIVNNKNESSEGQFYEDIHNSRVNEPENEGITEKVDENTLSLGIKAKILLPQKEIIRIFKETINQELLRKISSNRRLEVYLQLHYCHYDKLRSLRGTNEKKRSDRKSIIDLGLIKAIENQLSIYNSRKFEELIQILLENDSLYLEKYREKKYSNLKEV